MRLGGWVSSCRVTFRSPLELALGHVCGVARGLQHFGGGPQVANKALGLRPDSACYKPSSLNSTFHYCSFYLLQTLQPRSQSRSGTELGSDPQCCASIPQPSTPLQLSRPSNSNCRLTRFGCASFPTVPGMLQTGRIRVLFLMSLTGWWIGIWIPASKGEFDVRIFNPGCPFLRLF